MRALTLVAPMGQAVVYPSSNPKRFENRDKSMPKYLLGTTTVIAVHAGLKWNDAYETVVRRILPDFDIDKAKSQAGHIVGLMLFSGRQYTNADPPMKNGIVDPWFAGPVAFEIAEAELLPEPVLHRGGINFWPVLEAAEQEIFRQLPHWRGK